MNAERARDLRILVPYGLCLTLMAVTGARSFLSAPPTVLLAAELSRGLHEDPIGASGWNDEREAVELSARLDSLGSRVVLDWILVGLDGQRATRKLEVALDFYPTALACWDVSTLVVAGRGREHAVLERWNLTPPTSASSAVALPERVAFPKEITARIGPVQHVFLARKTRVPERFAAQGSAWLDAPEILVFGFKRRELTRIFLDQPPRWVGVIAGTRVWPGSAHVPELAKPFERFEQSTDPDGAPLYAFLAPERDEVLVLADRDGDALFDGPEDERRVVTLEAWTTRE